jgi:hypothetical protein
MTGDAYPPERRRDIGRRAIDQGRAFTHVYAWPHWVEPLLTAITIVTALARGLDYVAARPGEPCCSLEYLGIVGIHRWGLAYLVVAALVAVGVLLRMATGTAWLQISAHGVAQAVYGAFGMALLQGIFKAELANVESKRFLIAAHDQRHQRQVLLRGVRSRDRGGHRDSSMGRADEPAMHPRAGRASG